MLNEFEEVLSQKNLEELVFLGYQAGEEPIKLEKRDTDPNLAENRIVTSSKRLSLSRKFTRELADSMLNKAFELGIINEPLNFPIMEYIKPDDIDWQVIDQDFINKHLEKYEGTYLVRQNEQYLTYEQDGKVCLGVEDHVNPSEYKELWEHLSAGKNAILCIKGFELKWMPVPNYHASRQYFWSVHQYKEQVRKWEKLKSSIKKAQEFQTALDQHYKFKDLPFSWSVGVKQVIRDLTHKGLANGESNQTVVHLVLEEDYTKGRLVRVKGDYFCTPKVGKPNWTSSDYEYEIMVQGVKVKTISHEITCKTCLGKITTLLAAQEAQD